MRIETGRWWITAEALLCIFHFATAVASPIDGVWLSENKDARIKIHTCASDMKCGKIVWLAEPVYPPGSDMGRPGAQKRDKNNPDMEKRSQPLIGLEILKELRRQNERQWLDGRIYDPENGKIYRCRATLVDGDTLELRGYIGISLLGRTTKWTRDGGLPETLDSRANDD